MSSDAESGDHERVVSTEAQEPDLEHRGRYGVRKLAANIGSLLTSTVFERAMRFVLYAMVARSLGAADLGRLALAVAIFQVISRFAVAGIPVLTTREVAKRPGHVATYLVNGGVIVAATSALGYIALFGFVAGVGYEQETAQVIWLLFVGLLPFCWLRITEAVFIGLEQAKYLAYVNIPVNLAQTIGALVLLRWGYGVQAVALSMAIGYVLIAGIQIAVMAIRIRPLWTRPDVGVAGRVVRDASPFLGIEGTVVLRGSSNAVIISLILGETAVGIYSAAVQLQMPLRLVGSAVGTGLFPVMVRAYRRGLETLARAANRAVELIVAVVLPAVIGLVILGGQLLSLIYEREEFGDSATVLQLVAWTGLAMAVASILGRALVAANRELLTLRISIVNTTVQILVAVVLTIRVGVVGAAAAWLIVSLLNVAQHYVPIRRMFGSFAIWPMVWRPILASAMMAIALLVLSGMPVVALVCVGAVVYAGAFLGISLWSAGGREGLRRRWTLVGESETALA